VSAFDAVPTLTDVNEMEQDGDLDWYMEQVYDEIAEAHRERAHHDRDSFFCDYAGSEDCLALGHQPDDEGNWDDDNHQMGWDGDVICPATRSGAACSQCEGECNFDGEPLFGTREDLWKLVRA
jgi:hypothetical protein